MEPLKPPPARPVRSYVRRAGRMTVAQRRALADHWPRYGLPDSGGVEPGEVFGRDAPRVMEVGFGMGQVLLAMAAAHPERDFLGVEVHEPGLGRVMHELHQLGLGNVLAALVHRCLRPGGELQLATDWDAYAEEMLAVLEDHTDFANRAGPGGLMQRPPDRPWSRFELRGERLGHQVKNLCFVRKP